MYFKDNHTRQHSLLPLHSHNLHSSHIQYPGNYPHLISYSNNKHLRLHMQNIRNMTHLLEGYHLG